MTKSILCGINRPELLKDETLATLFSETAQKRPDQTALVFNGTPLSYAQLESWSNCMANELIGMGLTNGAIVGVWHHRSLELHVAILAIVKAGCTYVPLDYDMPLERVQTVFAEGGVSAYFSDKNAGMPQLRQLAVCRQPAGETKLLPIAYSPTTIAYILYTSGSTGKPKGIPISQRQICHLVRSENEVIGIRSSDIVYQGFSVSFDMWCEETWISYLAGATLIVADAATSKAVDELSDFLRRHRVTILHAVPSLLSVIDDAIPALRLVNAGGEACTPKVLAQWAKPGRVFYNSYGPTETTVTSSMIPLQAGDEITIGHPLPNYNYAVVDEQLRIVPIGIQGELVISGPCVGVGYVNLPELTAQKFVQKPVEETDLPGDRLYKTGDAAVIDASGKVIFHGRLDDQVKLRGYRIELGEIESQLAIQPGVVNAAVAIKKDSYGQDELVGYVQFAGDADFNQDLLRAELGKVLPVYMVPAVILPVASFGRLPSGKIDRKALPVPEAFKERKQAEMKAIDLNASVSERILTVLGNLFPGKSVTGQSDFFTDLGGHSLLAATFVSTLRKEAGIPTVSIKDVYLNRPLSQLIQTVEQAQKNQQEKREPDPFHPVKPLRYYLCVLGQLLALPVIFSFFAAQLYIPYLGYYYAQVSTENHLISLLIALVLFCFITPMMSVLSIGCKWLVIGRYKPGHYPLWGAYYFRYWLVNAMNRLVNVSLLNGTPLYATYMRFMGMKLGRDVQLSAFGCGAPDLVEVGDSTSISSSVLLNNVVIENGLLKISSIRIGRHCYLGTSAVVSGGCVMEDQSELRDLSCLPAGKVATEGGIYKGSPAQLSTKKEPAAYSHTPLTPRRTVLFFSALYSLLMLVFPFAVMVPFFPGLFTLYELDDMAGDYEFYYLILTPAIALVYVLLFVLQTVVFSRLLMRGVGPGRYPVYSAVYVRKWLSDQFCALSLFILHPVYATVYIGRYFRALGAVVGNNSEISTASNITPSLLRIGEEAFIADAVNLGEADVRDNMLVLEATSVGNRTFVGNSALVPQGTSLGDNMLIGVLSIPPEPEALQANPAKDWFGSPAIAMPQRQKAPDFDPALTFHPSSRTYLKRASIEFLRIILPVSFTLCFSWLFILFLHDVIVDKPWYMFVFYLPLYYLAFIGIPSFGLVMLLKWLLIGKYRRKQMPMWSPGVWLSEAVTSTHESLAVPYLLDYLQGTPFLPLCLRLLGVKIGKRACLYTTDFTEPDMSSLGDDVAMNTECGPQTHLFEDRIMKIGTVHIGHRSSIGARSIVLYDTETGNDVTVTALSLVMKGEQLADHTIAEGCPVRQG